MKRMFGLMPVDEVEKEMIFKDESELKIIVQAGPHGYSIIYADCSAEGEDIDGTTDENIERAKKILNSHFSNLTEVNKPD